MATIYFDVSGDVQVERTLERWADRAGDFTPAWQAMADDFLDIERDQFDSEGGRSSGGWDRLSPRYAAWKAVRFPGAPILVRTGDLEHSLTSGPEVKLITPTSMILGTSVPYATYHQHGTATMSQRRPVELTEQDRRRWVRILQEFLVYDRIGA